MKILALDGGGVFGRIQSHILSEAKCCDKFDAFAGTSIGAPQALCAALGKPELASPDFFDKWMGKIFYTTLLRRMNLFTSEYPDTGLNEALRKLFGSAVLGDAKKPIFITAADVGRKTLKVFSSANFDDSSWPAWEVCRCATAAETYFPSWKGYADGGIYANNPSMVALSAAVRVLGAKLEDVEILSIGTGEACCGGSYPKGRLTTAAWLIRAMLNGASDKMHDYFVRSMPIKKYTRINFVCDPGWEMDDPRSMYLAERKWAVEIQDAIQVMKEF
jgi:patatin-like phospholipase/acyl hydrolase